MGLASGLDTLCGQSFGAKQYQMLGIHIQRAMLVLSVVSVFLSIICLNTKPILIAMHQDHEISEEAGQYALFMIPSIFSYGLLQCLVRFLQTQNIVFPMMICSGITALFHMLLCWVLVFKSKLGSRGAALANSISYWINVLLMALYIKFSSSCVKTWTGFSKAALHKIPTFLKISIPSALMLCFKAWSFEIVVLLAGLLPNPKLETSVLSICLNTFAILWMIPFGLSAAVSTRVSNELGGGQPQAASLAVKVGLVMVIIEGVTVALLMILLRNIWGSIYSNEKEVVSYVASTMPILAISCFLDGIQSMLSGIARGCGWQKIGAYVNFGAFYLLGIPCATILVFVLHMRAKVKFLSFFLHHMFHLHVSKESYFPSILCYFHTLFILCRGFGWGS
ncbi:protein DETOXIFICATION 16-like [Ziziphus jujuba]|uniref:Protein DETOXIFICATION 16-like n=1 Tax=Ziziphus jujuba TaxID=326968 RepID=A0ABM3IKF1_ZIZJJ|nr:protein DETOXIFICATION 16-like [Ziziphus jujuba]